MEPVQCVGRRYTWRREPINYWSIINL